MRVSLCAHQRPPWHLLLPLLLAMFLLCGEPSVSYAQQLRVDTSQYINHFPLPDTAVPWRSTWGFNENEFSIGAYASIEVGPGDTLIWGTLRKLGIKILEVRPEDADFPRIDSLIDSAHGRGADGKWNERVITTAGFASKIGQAREVILYPFDSSQGYYSPCFFKNRQFGILDTNIEVKDHFFQPLKEVIYDSTNTPKDTIVAERMVFSFDTTRHTKRYPPEGYDLYDNHELSGDMFSWGNQQDLSTLQGGIARRLFFIVRAHLFDADNGGRSLTVGMDDTLLIIELYNERTIDQKYIRAWGDTAISNDTTAELYKRIYITKGQLLPDTTTFPLNYNTYREITDSLDMAEDAATGLGGPWNPLNASKGYPPSNQRFDIKIRWTGREKLALHSVALRDTMAQLLFGPDTLFRYQMIQKSDRLMHGTTSLTSTDWDRHRDSVLIRFYTGDEPISVSYAGFNWYDSTLYRRYGDTTDPARGPRAWHGRNKQDMQNVLLSSDNEICVETYPNHHLSASDRLDFGFPPDIYTRPAVREHNGGRFDNGPGTESMIPELVIDTTSWDSTRQGVERYTRFVQLMQLGTNMPEASISPWSAVGRQGSLLANAAWASRRTGRRLIHWPGLFGGFGMKWNDTTGHMDTTVRCILEPAEMRAAVNMGLCYGSHGVHYSLLGGNRLVHGANDSTGLNIYTDWGPHGPLTTDTANVVTLELKHVNTSNHNYVAVVPHMYTGWGVNSAEISWLDTVWLPTITTELLKLRWREGYSIHFTAPQLFMPDTSFQPRSRPLPSTEIVTKVEAFDIRGHKDSADVTFVELGLFDKQTDTNEVHDPMNDVHHIFVLNRRTFERSRDLNDTLPNGELTTRMKMMDSVAETRRIRLHMNLQHPDSTGWNYIRIVERGWVPDTLPLAHGPRRQIDTVVRGDSAIDIVLGPGRAALLEIRYLDPAAPLEAGSLQFNNQRKFIFDGRRYHLTYHIIDTSTGTSTIYYRRSVPIYSGSDSLGVYSPGNDAAGAIRWEPYKYIIASDDAQYHAHRYPSMTLRVRNDDTVATIVWTADDNDTLDPDVRAVLLCDVAIPSSGFNLAGPIERVGYHHGSNPTQWGTPCVSSLGGGQVVVWSDDNTGINARYRKLLPDSTSTHWWWANGGYSSPIVVPPGPNPPAGQYPSVPTFTHIRLYDSSCGLVWQYPMPTGINNNHIWYARLVDSAMVAGDTLLVINNMVPLTSSSGQHYHPSMDQVQDVWGMILEGVTWETHNPQVKNGMGKVWVHFSTVYTPYDTFRTNLHLMEHWRDREVDLGLFPQGMMTATYPNTSSLNGRYDSTTQNEKVLFSVAYYNQYTSSMHQALVEYSGEYIWPASQTYTYGGWYPNGSANRVVMPPYYDSTWSWYREYINRQPIRPAVMYQTLEGGDSLFRSSKQFFAKTRPHGYMANGREVFFRISDSLSTGIGVRLHDVWYATDSAGYPLPMIPLDSTTTRTDSLSTVAAVFRTASFTGSDSVQIGFEVAGSFAGDSAIAATAYITCVVELVDSATGSVVQPLDSFVVSTSDRNHSATPEPIVDILSGTYYVRLRFDASAMPEPTPRPYARYPMTEVFGWVDDPPLGKLRRTGATTGAQSRVTAQPNPSTGATEIRFSIPYRDYVAVTVYDGTGREVARPVGREMMEAGRYAIDYDGTRLQAGTYLIEVRTSSERVVEKFVVVR